MLGYLVMSRPSVHQNLPSLLFTTLRLHQIVLAAPARKLTAGCPCPPCLPACPWLASTLQVGHSVARRRWAETTAHVNLSLTVALGCGIASAGLLAVLRQPVFVGLLHLTPAVQGEATPYFWLRVAAVPLQLINMAAAGILQARPAPLLLTPAAVTFPSDLWLPTCLWGACLLNCWKPWLIASETGVPSSCPPSVPCVQGFHHVGPTAALGISQALLELAGSAATLLTGHGLLGVGLATLLSQLLLTGASLACLLLLPPPEARGGQFSLREVWFGKGGIDSSGIVSRAAEDGITGQLLGQEEQPTLRMEFPSSAAAAEGEHHILEPASPRPLTPRWGSSSSRGAGSPGIPYTGDPARPAGPGDGKEREEEEEEGEEHTWAFLRDGADFFVRSLILQLTFFAALSAATRLGTAALAAHSIISQCWVLLSNLVDGLASAGIVLGSRLAGLSAELGSAAAARASAQRLVRRLVLAGLALGLAAAAGFWAAERSIIQLFTGHAEVAAQLAGPAWAVLAASQPLNAAVFVYDGWVLPCSLCMATATRARTAVPQEMPQALPLPAPGPPSPCPLYPPTPAQAAAPACARANLPCHLCAPACTPACRLLYAAQGFAFIRRNFLSGFFLIFCPLLTVEWVWVQQLYLVWLAKTAFNVWRCGGALWLVHGTWLQNF